MSESGNPGLQMEMDLDGKWQHQVQSLAPQGPGLAVMADTMSGDGFLFYS